MEAGDKAVDAGKPIPNVNDGFAGRAPDLGAHEVGQPMPVYRPRGRTGNRPFYWQGSKQKVALSDPRARRGSETRVAALVLLAGRGCER